MKLSKQEVFNLYTTLQSLQGEYTVKFAYGVSRNKHRLEPEYKAIQEVLEFSEEFKTYRQELEQLKNKHILKDADGKPVQIAPETFKIDTKSLEFSKGLESLQGKFKDTIEAQKAKDKENIAFLKEEIDIECFPMSIRTFPEVLQQGVLEVLMPLVRESDEEVEKYLGE